MTACSRRRIVVHTVLERVDHFTKRLKRALRTSRAQRTFPSPVAADGRTGRNRYRTACLGKIDTFSQVLTSYAWNTSPMGTASVMAAVMLEKQPEQWDRVWTASCPLIVVKQCFGPALDRLRTETLTDARWVKTEAELLVSCYPMAPARVWHGA